MKGLKSLKLSFYNNDLGKIPENLEGLAEGLDR